MPSEPDTGSFPELLEEVCEIAADLNNRLDRRSRRLLLELANQMDEIHRATDTHRTNRIALKKALDEVGAQQQTIRGLHSRIKQLEQDLAARPKATATANANSYSQDLCELFFGNGANPIQVRALATLGRTTGASRDQIQAAYRSLIAIHHPDHGGSSERAAAINSARDTLINSGRLQ